MPQLLRFEGSTPEEARNKARLALGENVVVVRAGRERRGGVLGFFEHETYVLEVDAATGEPPGQRSRPPGQLAGPLAAGGAVERLADGIEDDFELTRGQRAASGYPSAGYAEPAAGQAAGAYGEPAERVPAGDGAEHTPEFSQLLREAEAAVAGAAAGPPERGYAEPVPAWAMMDGPVQQPAGRPEERGAHLAGERNPGWRDEPGTGHADGTPAQPGAPWPPDRSGRGATPPGGPAASRSRPAVRLLRELGLPDDLLPGDELPLELGLVDRLRRLPRAPELPALPDAVVLVAGSQQHLAPITLSLARRLDVGPEGIVVVSSRPCGLPASVTMIGAARDAAAEVADRRIARRPCVVAVECRPTGPLPRLLAHVATAVRPDAAWAVVPAQCHPDDLHDLAEAMRRLDAVSVVEFDAAERPAAVLAAGYPVAALDRRAATPLMWAARLVDRCTAEGDLR